jgi:predicted GTPase
MWVNFYNCGIHIAPSFDRANRKKALKKEGREDVGDLMEVVSHNERVKAASYEQKKADFMGSTMKTMDFLKGKPDVTRRISAEIKNTGKSATAKKISEVLA